MMQGYAAIQSERSFAVAPPGVGYAVAGPVGNGDDELEKQAGRFISGTFFGLMLKAMRDTVPKDGLLDGGRAEEVFRDFFDRELADRFSQGKNFPLVEAAVRQLRGQTVYRAKMPRHLDEPDILKIDGGRP